MLTITGQCHCGNLSSSMTLPAAVGNLTVFGCPCSFCRLQGASWFGGPGKDLQLTAELPSQATWYVAGQHLPRILLCQHCGVVVAAVTRIGGQWYGVINAKTAVLPALPQDFLPLRAEPMTEQEREALRQQTFAVGVHFAGGLQPPELPEEPAFASAANA
ncbi:hypothetical protein HPT27_07645 [Permianibacter sp. IMCC34836]|uniref:GFA family protein n=1 Tax=Permianibacter fluminis TaxID=2738515 RepID=UPI0015544D8D|nr:hypothetical protein [Permianibacter fluminis]NQD36897.1 hypothetical protein [Permianibacter fluminis]